MAKLLKLNYFVGADEGDIDEDKFWNDFVEFVEARGWYFGGSHELIDDAVMEPEEAAEMITCPECQEVSQQPDHWICEDCKLKEE